MGFLSPWFLAALAAVGLPVWLHLLRRHRSTPLPFSSLMFFERRIQSSVKHRRLRYLVLFTLRTALVALLALAFARPFRETASAGAGGAKLVLLALDESFSMRQGDRMARARGAALDTLSRLGAGDRVQVVAFAGAVRMLTQPTQDRAALRAAIQSIEPTDSRSSYGELVRAARAVAESVRLPVEIHLFSDLQKSSLPPAFADLRLPAGARLIPRPVAASAPANWAVENAQAPGRLYDPKKARVQATVAGFGAERARRRVSLVLNGRLVESKEIAVPAGGRASVEFAGFETRHGPNRGEVRIEPADAFPEDDRRFVAIDRDDARPVLFVHEARERRGPLYFRTALEAAGNGFRVEEATPEQAAGRSPSSYAFVVLSDVGGLQGNFAAALHKYAEEGGAVWIALGPATAARHRVPLLGASIQQERANGFQTVSHVDAGHPSLRGAGQWEAVKFYQTLRVESSGARVVARLADQTPLLMEKQLGRGRVLLFASTFDNVSNDLPLRAAFVPFIEQTAAYLGGQAQSFQSLAVDSHLPLRSAGELGTAIEVIDPRGRRALSLDQAATAETVAVTQAGFYELRRGSGRHETVAVNADPRESDLELIPGETLALWQKTGQGGGETPGAAGSERRRQDLGWYALLVVLALVVAESWIGNRHLDVEREAG